MVIEKFDEGFALAFLIKTSLSLYLFSPFAA